MKTCKYFERCGGCKNLLIPYDTQLEEKSKWVKNLFNKYSVNIDIPKTIGMFFPYKYRNKIHLSIKSLKGKTIVGFFEEGSSKVTDIDSCLLHPDWAADLIALVRNYLKKYRITPYDPITKSGTIRYVVARVLDGQAVISLVMTSNNFAGRDYLYAKLQEIFKKVSLYVNINKRTDKLVFDANGFKLIAGDKYLESKILGVKFLSSPNSFLQVNTEICKAMYQKACEWLELGKEDNVLDLYSGIGITSIYFAKFAKSVTSIEYNSEATSMAVLNKKLNETINLDIRTGACEKVVKDLDITKYNKIFLDPARAGVEDGCIKSLLDSNAETIVYMSCNPETLARDVKKLLGKYDISQIQTYDMFAQTPEVETLVCLKRKS
ncbi:MAG: 23S rRNA (uracil(1939)-C(5))-methyltransferase RlmD [Clostridia bacterium]|nr:23S rRNA (uracil(1939)-C(5))-methyltransferase RlmD [Clostridia bacterium]